MRLAKYIAAAGHCSRRAASRLIESGGVTVNGVTASHIQSVSANDQVCINGQPVLLTDERAYLIYNKPVGIDCVCEPDNAHSIIHHIHWPVRVFPVGRLDKDSHGLMLLTNDGELCQRVLHPDFYHEKDYRVDVNQPVTPSFLQAMAQGVTYKKRITTRPCRIHQTDSHSFQITLTQGLNRQIRNMCQSLGYKVVNLQRVRLVNLHLGELPLNQCRPLLANEVSELISSTGQES